MTRFFTLLIVLFLLSISSALYSQEKASFGDISLEDLQNKPYNPDPGADAIILSDIATATLGYQSEFYIELVRDVRIRIVNSEGYDRANIEIPYLADDRFTRYEASTFNLVNGEKTETKIPGKNFIIENTSRSYKTLKFNFPDVHEGSVIEYSYTIRLKNYAIFEFVPWEFQSDIPVIKSSFTAYYPDAFTYKNIISGSAGDVLTSESSANSMFFGRSVNTRIRNWSAKNVPAFRPEPDILSKKEHLNKITFELTSVDFPNISLLSITPTYANLTEKLLDRDDFGTPLKTNLKSLAEEITGGSSDELTKLKKIHKYVTTSYLWDGEEDYTASAALRNMMRKEKGNSADLNILLIVLLRSVGVKADPVILSTRSNGSLNQYSAMMQQFNYLVASVTVNRQTYLVDATDPLRPFNVLPFDCLNGSGRLINEIKSDFVDLKNNERNINTHNLVLNINKEGDLTGNFEFIYSDYKAYDIRKTIRLESEEGYIDGFKASMPNAELIDFKISNAEDCYSDLIVKSNFLVRNGTQTAGDEIIFNPYLFKTSLKNPFYSPERKFPIDFGCPKEDDFSMTMIVPEGYSVMDKPGNVIIKLGKDDGRFEFRCEQEGNKLKLVSTLNISKIVFSPAEYSDIQKFYTKIQKKQSEFIVFKKN